MSDWRKWIGGERASRDVLTPGLAARLNATLDRAGSDVPGGAHWCLCLPDAATGTLGGDGHPPRGEFLPPIPLPRRMWASSDIEFHRGLQIGDVIEQLSRIERIEEKAGASGRLAFVTVQHEMSANGAPAISERQTIVYREPPTGPAPRKIAAPEQWQWERALTPSPVLLFRYSALTFNSHRIHYDLPYAREEEGYEGLVVHGPLTATLLLDLIVREGCGDVARFSFRGEAPAFAGRPLILRGCRQGEEIKLAAFDEAGVRVMSATAVPRDVTPAGAPGPV